MIGWGPPHSNLHTCIKLDRSVQVTFTIFLRSSNAVKQKSNDPFNDLLNKKHKVKKKNPMNQKATTTKINEKKN